MTRNNRIRANGVRAGAFLAFVLAEGVAAHPRPVDTAFDGVRLVGATDVVPDDNAYVRGKQLLAADDAIGALAAFRQALTAAPDSADAMNGIGVAYDRLGRTDLARRFYRAGLAITPNSPALLNNLGYSLFISGDLAGAIAPLRAAAASNDNDAAAAAQVTLARLTAEPRGSRLAAAPTPTAPGHVEVTSDTEQRLSLAAVVPAADVVANLGEDAPVVAVAAAWRPADDAALIAQVHAEEAADSAVAVADAAAAVPAAVPMAEVEVAVTEAPPSPPVPIFREQRPTGVRTADRSPGLILAMADATPRRRVRATDAGTAATLSDGPQPRAAVVFDSDDAELNAFATRVKSGARATSAIASDRGRIAARFRA